MAVFVVGILSWLLAVILLFWSKSRKSHRKRQSGFDSYPIYLSSQAFEFVLWGIGDFLGLIYDPYSKLQQFAYPFGHFHPAGILDGKGA